LRGLFTTLYTTLGGIKAAIWTDVIQFTVLMLGAFTICGFALARIPGGWSGFYQINSQAGKFGILNFSLNPRELTSIWATLIGGGVMTLPRWRQTRLICNAISRQSPSVRGRGRAFWMP